MVMSQSVAGTRSECRGRSVASVCGVSRVARHGCKRYLQSFTHTPCSSQLRTRMERHVCTWSRLPKPRRDLSGPKLDALSAHTRTA